MEKGGRSSNRCVDRHHSGFVCAVSWASKSGQGQEDLRSHRFGLVLHLNVRRVPVDVVVLDKQGNVVRGLKKKDFILKEDGKTQNVVSFDWDGRIDRELHTAKAAFAAGEYIYERAVRRQSAGRSISSISTW